VENFIPRHCVKLLITRNTLDCDQSNYSSRIVFSNIPIEFGQTGISAIKIRRPRNTRPRTKHGVNRIIRRGGIFEKKITF